MLYASAANTYAEVTTSPFGRGLLNTDSGTVVSGLNADTVDGYHSSGLWRTDNAGSTSYDWSAKNLTLAGTITGATTITASSDLSVGGDVNVSATSTYLYDGVQALKLAKGTDTFYANTFVGNGAGNSSAYRQTALGYYAGYLNTGASQTALGFYAGRENSGANQTALGNYAGYSNTGTDQTALGFYAGRENTGAYQTALGYAAGYLKHRKFSNSFRLCCRFSNTGTYQTAVGHAAGYQNAGDRVIGIGYEATRGNTATADDVVAIGYQAGKDNTVANQFIVKQANINAVPLIQGDFSTGNVGIGYTDPGSYRLKVNGSGYFNSNLTVGGTLGVTGATTLSGILDVIGSTTLAGGVGITSGALTISGKDSMKTPYVDFRYGTTGTYSSRIIEDVQKELSIYGGAAADGKIKLKSDTYAEKAFYLGSAKFTYETDGGVGFLKLAHSDGSTAMHFVTTGGQTMYSTGVPAAGGGGGAIIQLNDVIYGEGSTAKIYSPTGPGTPGYILKAADPSGFPEWVNISNLLPDATTSVKGVAKLSGSGLLQQ